MGKFSEEEKEAYIGAAKVMAGLFIFWTTVFYLLQAFKGLL